MARKKAVTTARNKTWNVVPFQTDNWDVSAEFVSGIERLESEFGLPVWLLLQDGDKDGDWDSLSENAKNVFFTARSSDLKKGQKIALLMDTYGGSARSAYEIATLLRRHCGGFTALIPRHAKSAGTLLALGADEIVLGEYGELGPLDVQTSDREREEWISGLDEVQSLERLSAFVMTSLDQAMFLLLKRTGMKVATLLPHVSRLVTDMTEPMFANIDVVRYTQMSRALKVGEEYARRLLKLRVSDAAAAETARKLVENYPEHGFIIDRDEAENIGLKLGKPTTTQLDSLRYIGYLLEGVTAVGVLKERIGAP